MYLPRQIYNILHIELMFLPYPNNFCVYAVRLKKSKHSKITNFHVAVNMPLQKYLYFCYRMSVLVDTLK